MPPLLQLDCHSKSIPFPELPNYKLRNEFSLAIRLFRRTRSLVYMVWQFHATTWKLSSKPSSPQKQLQLREEVFLTAFLPSSWMQPERVVEPE